MKSIDELLEGIANKKLLVIFPHPDDESVMAGGLIQRAIRLGYEVTVLTLTEGDRGRIYINGRGRSVSEIRRREMAKAMSTLRVTDWIMWKFEDGKLRWRRRWRRRLLRFVVSTNPGMIVTYDLSGVSGHPDHISAALELRKVAKNLKGARLFWVSFDGWEKTKLVSRAVLPYLMRPKYVLRLSLVESWRKWRAAFSHKSQSLSSFLGTMWWVLVLVARQEWYSEPVLGERYKYRYTKFKI